MMDLIKYQISVFMPDASFGSMRRVSEFLLGQASGILDADPVILPTADAPPQIPRIILKSREKDKELTLTLERLTLSFIRRLDNPISDEERDAFRQQAIQWITAFKNEFSVVINRVGVVNQQAWQPQVDDCTYGEFLARRFCKEQYFPQPFRNARKFEVHCRKNYDYAGLDVNSWVRLQTMAFQPDQREFISVLNDLNNAPVDGDMTLEQLESFISGAEREIEGIIQHYQLEG
jgi:hypothetical protein